LGFNLEKENIILSQNNLSKFNSKDLLNVKKYIQLPLYSGLKCRVISTTNYLIFKPLIKSNIFLKIENNNISDKYNDIFNKTLSSNSLTIIDGIFTINNKNQLIFN